MPPTRVLRSPFSALFGWSMGAWTVFIGFCMGMAIRTPAGADPEATWVDTATMVVCAAAYAAGLVPAVMGIQRHPLTRAAAVVWAGLAVGAELLSTVGFLYTHSDPKMLAVGLAGQVCCFSVPLFVLAYMWLAPTDAYVEE